MRDVARPQAGVPGFLVCVFAVLLANALAAEEPISRENLVRNPGFAEGLKEWTAAPEGKAPALQPEIDRGVFRGNDMASLKIPIEDGKQVRLIQTGLPYDPRVKKYRFSVWIKSKGLSPDWIARVGVQAWKKGACFKWIQNTHVPCGADQDWAPTVFEIEAPAGTEQFAVYVGVWFSDKQKPEPPKPGAALWYDDVSLEPVIAEQTKPLASASPTNEKIAVQNFYPLGERGLFAPGQPAQVSLVLRNNEKAPTDLGVEVSTKDFWDVPGESKALKLTAQPGVSEHTIELPAPGKVGFFCVKAEIKKGGTLIAWPKTGFCVVQPIEKTDPFFGIDPNGLSDDLLGAFRLIGVGSLGIYQPWNVSAKEVGDLKAYMQKQVETRWAPCWKSDFNIVAYVKIDPEFHSKRIKDETLSRRQKGLYPSPDELFAELGDAVEAEAIAMKDRVKTWVIQEEIDAWISNPKAPAGSGTCELARHVLMTRIAYDRLKKVNPNCEVGAFGICMDYKGDPPFQLVRRVMPELKDSFDMIALDAYCEAYELGKSKVMGPESAKLREVLLNTQKLQREWNKSRNVLIAEKGMAVPYHLPPDHDLQKRFANLQARNLILAKSVSTTIFYSLFTGVSPWAAMRMTTQGLQSTDDNPISDFGIWKAMYDGKSFTYQPRSAVAAYATVARMLSNATDPEELNVRQGFYAYLFKKGENAVAALWTTEPRPYSVRIELPVAADACDLMGNARSLPAGATELEMSESPIFLTCKAAPRVLADAIQKTVFPSLPPVKAEARLSDLSTLTLHLVNQTQQPVEAEIDVDSPKLSERTKKASVPASDRVVVDFQLTGTPSAPLQARVKANGQVIAVTEDLSVLSVAKAPENMKVDGDLSKYAKITPIVLDKPEYIYPSEAAMPEKHLWSGPEDLSVQAWLAYDAKFFYIAMRVKDDIHLQRQKGELIWMDDCVQFAFDTMNDDLRPETTGAMGYDAHDYNYGMALTADGPQCYCWVEKGKTKTGGSRAFPLAVKRERGETIYELAIPWENLAPLAPTPGKVFGLSFLVFDSDRPEDPKAPYWMGLTPGIANGQDPSAYKKFVLVP